MASGCIVSAVGAGFGITEAAFTWQPSGSDTSSLLPSWLARSGVSKVGDMQDQEGLSVIAALEAVVAVEVGARLWGRERLLLNEEEFGSDFCER